MLSSVGPERGGFSYIIPAFWIYFLGDVLYFLGDVQSIVPGGRKWHFFPRFFFSFTKIHLLYLNNRREEEKTNLWGLPSSTGITNVN